MDFKTRKISSPVGLTPGNLVYNRHGEMHSLRRNDLATFDHPDMGGNYGLYAIPITTELLERAGFTKIQEGSMSHPEIYRIKYTKRIVINVFDIQMRGGDENYWAEGNTIVELESLHHLQNLFLAITGQELEFT